MTDFLTTLLIYEPREKQQIPIAGVQRAPCHTSRGPRRRATLHGVSRKDELLRHRHSEWEQQQKRNAGTNNLNGYKGCNFF